jgi:hypothetical protein
MSTAARPAAPCAPTTAAAGRPRLPQGRRRLGGVAGWVDDRTGAAKGVGYLMKKVFPDHWSFMLGEIAMYSMIICLLTGVFLTFWFVPPARATSPTTAPTSRCRACRCPRPTPRRWTSPSTSGRPAHPADAPLGRLMFIVALSCTCCASSSPAPSASRVSSTGSSAASCRCSPRRGLRRLLAPRRPALGHRPAGR